MKTIAVSCLLACVGFFILACERKPDALPAPAAAEAAPAVKQPTPAPQPVAKADDRSDPALPNLAEPAPEEGAEAERVKELEARVKQLEQALKQAGESYRGWRRVNESPERMPNRRLPFVPPPREEPPRPETAAPSGELPTLLYLMFAKYPVAYAPVTAGNGEAAPQPEGQVLIKESYVAHADDPTKPDYAGYLYVMLKVNDRAPDSDNGWVYGVLSKDGKRVLAAGKLEVCVTCHVKAGQGRLFGVPFDTPLTREVAMR